MELITIGLITTAVTFVMSGGFYAVSNVRFGKRPKIYSQSYEQPVREDQSKNEN